MAHLPSREELSVCYQGGWEELGYIGSRDIHAVYTVIRADSGVGGGGGGGSGGWKGEEGTSDWGGEGILTWFIKKRTSAIVCIFKGTNPVNGPYRDLLLRLGALWQLSPYLEGAVRFRGPLGQWVTLAPRASFFPGALAARGAIYDHRTWRDCELLSFNLLSRN